MHFALVICITLEALTLATTKHGYTRLFFADKFRPGSSEWNSPKLNFKGSIRKFLLLSEALQDESSNTDMVCSPITALLGVAKLGFGAHGDVRTEIETAIGDKFEKGAKQSVQNIIRTLNTVPGIYLSVGSHVYMPQTYQLDPDYRDKTYKYFGSSVMFLDFNRPENAARIVNNWVASITKGRIRDFLDPSQLEDYKQLLMANAVYFKGHWKYDFPLTISQRFYDGNRTYVVVPMMKNEREYLFYHSDALDAQVIEIPFHGDRASMIMFLPTSVTGLRGMMAKMMIQPSFLGAAVNQMKLQRIRLSVPRFSIRTTLDLVNLLKKLEIKGIFSPGGLNGITRSINNLFIKLAIQKSFIEVDNSGTLEYTSTTTTTTTASTADDDEGFTIHAAMNSDLNWVQQLPSRHPVTIENFIPNCHRVAIMWRRLGIFASNQQVPESTLPPTPNFIEVNADHPFMFMIIAEGEQILGGVYAASNEKNISVIDT